MTVVDALLSRVIARGPTVLVVDDVQWADPATWDALSYLVAGFARQRMALLTTHRDEAAGSEHFQHWLGNVRRLPGTEELVLARLDEDATTDQIAVLLGRPPEPRLVEQVFEKSRGNPYFSELLVRRGDLRLRRAARRPARRAQPGAAGRPGGGCRPRRGRSPGSWRSPAARPSCERWPQWRRSSASPMPGRSVRPSTPGWWCSVAAKVSGSGTRCWPRCWPSPTCPARRRRCTRRGRPTSSRSPPRVSTSCAVSATSRRTTSMPAKASRRSPRSCEAPTSPRSSARLARPPTCWPGRPTCGTVAADATDTVGHAQLLERAGEACAVGGAGTGELSPAPCGT